MELISLLTLVVVIAIGVITDKNIGMMGLAVALVLGIVAGVPTNDIIAGFPTGLFINLTGMFFFFSIAQLNGSLELLSKKVFNKLAGIKSIYPILVFIVSALITLVDPGGLTSYVVLPAIAMGIGYQMGYNPILIGIFTIYGSNATIMTPVGVFGSIANSLIDANNYPDFSMQILFNGVMMFAISAAIAYGLFRGWRLNQNTIELSGAEIGEDLEELPAFDRNQKLTLAMLVLMIASIMFLQTHAGLTAIFFSVILLLANAANEKEAFAGVPWETIFLVVGISTLLTVIELLGGMDLLANFFTSIVTRWIAAPILGFTSSVMSFFALAMAGPVPALIPTIDRVNEAIGSPFHPVELISTIINGGFTAAISPLSMGGAMIMAAYDTLFKVEKEERTKTFNKLFATAIGISIIAGIIANTGIYRLFI